MARRRFQNGSVRKKGKAWELRWREDVDGQRILCSEVFASLKQYPTKRLALRDPFVTKKLAELNSLAYMPRRSRLFDDFANQWSKMVLVNYKPSTQLAIRSQLKKYLVPRFTGWWLSDIDSMVLQQFISSLRVSPKTVRNLIVTLRMMWNTAKAWTLVNHDPFAGIVLPKREPVERRFFTLDEMRQIITEAEEPMRTFYWLAAETGMRAGELCGLRKVDVDVDGCFVRVRQSVWRGQGQMPKSKAAIRAFSISPELALHVRSFVAGQERKIDSGLLFQTRTGTPWDGNLVVKRKLHPLLTKLGIERAGLHAFRHGNASLMDRFNVPMRVRQSRLGHMDAETTMGYTHMISADETNFVDQLGAELVGA